MKSPIKTKQLSPNPLDRVRKLAMNLWWTWNASAQRLFASLDPMLWAATNQSPLKTLRMLAPERKEALANDPAFLQHLDQCERDLQEYLSAKTWFDRTHKSPRRPRIGYFCAEFAIHESVPQYSGGLGVLAGDHLKSASDLGIPLVAIGLLYRCGYYTQGFNPDGSTRVIYPQLDFSDLPVKDTGKTIAVPMARRKVHAKIWLANVGRTRLYFLDTDIPANRPQDRTITRHLYGGDRKERIEQEILLGVGGVLALDALKVAPTVVHLNEGHAAFAALERLRRLRVAGVDHDRAVETVRRAGVFTTHTPVPAGNDRFTPQLTMKYLVNMLNDLGLSREQLLGLGREDPSNKSEEFCMTVLALRLSKHCNGVAALHGEVSRQMWKHIYNAGHSRDVPIGHVTNGIHSQTWLAEELLPLYERYLKPQWDGASAAPKIWNRVDRIPTDELWNARNLLRRKLVQFVRQRMRAQVLRQNGSLQELIDAASLLDENVLTIGFARRFATYKRAPLVFHDPKRLASILSNLRRPVQMIFAGKAHPKDMGGQEFAQEIYQHAHSKSFRGRVVLLDDYDMQLGRILTAGSDVWLNNPLRPQEASGTSGMKPPLHGGINCSISDGWWPEAANGTNGWTIGGKTFAKQSDQDRYDATSIYDLLEREIVPAFYDRDRANVPQRWMRIAKESMKTVCSQFNTHRMLVDYFEKYYLPAHG
jgi:glycogen phosphorylase